MWPQPGYWAESEFSLVIIECRAPGPRDLNGDGFINETESGRCLGCGPQGERNPLTDRRLCGHERTLPVRPQLHRTRVRRLPQRDLRCG